MGRMGDSEYRGAGIGGKCAVADRTGLREQIYTMEDALLFAGMMMIFCVIPIG